MYLHKIHYTSKQPLIFSLKLFPNPTHAPHRAQGTAFWLVILRVLFSNLIKVLLGLQREVISGLESQILVLSLHEFKISTNSCIIQLIMFSLAGKTAIVTGATRGIGRAIAIRLSELGCKVVGVYKSNDKLASELGKQYKNIYPIKADIGQEKEIEKVIKTTINKFNTLDFLVNNVGIDIFGEIKNYRTEDWDEMINVNLRSVFLFSRDSIPYLNRSNNPVIINISSRIGYLEFTEPKFVVYGAVKAGVTNFTVGLSKELINTGIRVNAIIPTPTKTDLFNEVFTPEEEEILKKKGKLGKPEEVADLVLKLIMDKTANGKILVDKRVSL